ncbi:MAG: hypothetical protein SFZ03_04420 [Candidatus Melainabacteria bacterium]|nr:hypothetical protein [Candidatus Melainabacteria bacterium]
MFRQFYGLSGFYEVPWSCACPNRGLGWVVYQRTGVLALLAVGHWLKRSENAPGVLQSAMMSPT